jgi:hypothetical protein
MVQLTGALTEFAKFKEANPDFATMETDNRAFKGYVAAIQENEVA